MPRDLPIMFSAPMVRALLAGRKTQTRRMATSPLARAEPGDRLWVRESFRGAAGYEAQGLPPAKWGNKPTWYVADGDPDPARWWHLSARTRPAIHMPRWASRLTLVVTEVRRQRLQDISEADARAEGMPITWDGKPYEPPPASVDHWQGYARASFFLLWGDLHGPSLKDNPAVVALSFAVHRVNIDQMEVSDAA